MKALKGIVIIMSFAIAILMTLIVYGMYQKSQNPDFRFFSLGGDKTPAAKVEMAPQVPPQVAPTPKVSTNVSRAVFGDVSLGLAPDARVVSAHIESGRLVIVVAQKGNTKGDLVVVIDLANGNVLGRVKMAP